ncbi:MAG: clostripain-related cysteine peptidase [Alistipes sp.]
MKKSLLHLLWGSLIMTLLLCSCDKDTPEQPHYPPRPHPAIADQTLMVYLSGQDLIGFFRANVQSMQQVVNNYMLKDSRLLVFSQPTQKESLVVEYSFDYNSQRCVADTLLCYSYFCSTTSDGIQRILSAMANVAPAKQYGLIMGSHATAWVPSHFEFLAPNAVGKSSSTDNIWQKAEGADVTRWFGLDQDQRTDITALAKGIADSKISFEYLIFDACFMSNIETLYDLRHSAKQIVASPCEVMGKGFPYERILPYLLTEEGRSYDLQQVCYNFYDYYAHTTETRQSGCIALTNCAEIDALAATMRQINSTASTACDYKILQKYDGLHQYDWDQGIYTDRPLFFDLGDYVRALTPAPAALQAFEAQFEATFPKESRLYTPSFYSAFDNAEHPINSYSGVSISTPTPNVEHAAANKETAWYKATH